MNRGNLFIVITVLVLFINIHISGEHIQKTSENNKMKIFTDQTTLTILYDNYPYKEYTKTEWGFSCLIQTKGQTILFDTGGKGDTLLHNMKKLKLSSVKIDKIVISHNHWDHAGGVFSILKNNPKTPVYLPISFPEEFDNKVKNTGSKAFKIKDPVKLYKNIYLTGELDGPVKEQSLIIDTQKGLVIITGCSHPGIVKIVKKAKTYLGKKVYLVFGGFHLMRQSDEQIKKIIANLRELGVEKCGATHCTGDRQIKLFKEDFKENYIKIGAGSVIKITKKGLEMN